MNNRSPEDIKAEFEEFTTRLAEEYQFHYDDEGRFQTQSGLSEEAVKRLVKEAFERRYFTVTSLEEAQAMSEFVMAMRTQYPDNWQDLESYNLHASFNIGAVGVSSETLKEMFGYLMHLPASVAVEFYSIGEETIPEQRYASLADYIAATKNALEINLSDNPGITDVDGLHLVCKALQERNSSAPVILDLSGCNVNANHMQDIIPVIKNHRYALNLNLSGNKGIGDDGIRKLVAELTKDVPPHRLALNLNGCKLSPQALNVICDMLGNRLCPTGLMLELRKNKFDKETIAKFAMAMLDNRKVSQLDISPDIGDKQDYALIQFCIERNNLQSEEDAKLTLDLSDCTLTSSFVKALARELTSGNYPFPVELNFSKCKLDAECLNDIIGMLESHHCPRGLTLNLASNVMSEEQMASLAQKMLNNTAVTGVNLPRLQNDGGLEEDQNINRERALIGFCVARNHVAQQGGGPIVDLKLNLSGCTLSPEFVNALVTSLTNGQFPSNANPAIFLRRSILDEAGIESICSLIASRKCPQGLSLDLRDTVNINADHIKRIAVAMLANTGVLNLSSSVGEESDISIINFCLLRNRMLAEYPEHAPLIKQFCEKHKLYVPAENERRVVPSLKSLAAASSLGMFGAKSNKAEVPANVPQEVKDFLKEVERAGQVLNVSRVAPKV